MGIINFVREAGASIGLGESPSAAAAEAERDEQLAELREGNKLLRLIQQMDLGVDKPKVSYDDGIATVWGTAPSQKVKENVLLTIGNCRGVEAVDDRMEVVEPAPEALFYTVKKGDTLGAIAKEHLGSAGRYTEVFEANRPMLEHPDRIYPGQVLRIPRA